MAYLEYLIRLVSELDEEENDDDFNENKRFVHGKR